MKAVNGDLVMNKSIYAMLSLIIVSTLSVQATTQEDFLNINRQYTEAYFDYLQFKKSAVANEKELRVFIEESETPFLQAQKAYQAELLLLQALEVSDIPDQISTLEATIEALISDIISLKDEAINNKYFTATDDINTTTIDQKVATNEALVVKYDEIVEKLEDQLVQIRSQPEWIALVNRKESFESQLNSSVQTRVTLEGQINRFRLLIEQTTQEVENLRDYISDLNFEECFGPRFTRHLS
jgi:hypothetical protein